MVLSGLSVREAASMFGKDSGLFVPSGTMANLIAIMVHCEIRGSEMIVGDKSHIHVGGSLLFKCSFD